jgi:hypothetical protein
MQRYVIISLLENLRDGEEFKPENYPLHITIVPSFRLGRFTSELEQSIVILCAELSPIRALVEGDEYFGPNKEVHVSAIAANDELRKLHDGVAKLLSAAGAEFDEPQYMGGNYRAHATVQPHTRLEPGIVVVIGAITVIDKFPGAKPNLRKPLWTINLGR